MKLISIIVPCYNEQEALPFFYDEIVKTAAAFEGVNFEFVFVNDGSKDNSLSMLREYSKIDLRVRYISFSRNFGKEAAIYAGLEHSKGDFVALLDCDLQDPPSLLIEMYNGIVHEGYDCVATRRKTRKGEPVLRSFFSNLFYKIINKISKTEIVNGARDFRMMTRQMVDAILQMSEYNRFSKGIFSWVGFDVKWLEYDNIERVAGQTKWSFWKLLIYSLEGVVSFSTAPLAISSLAGIAVCLLSLIGIIIIVIRQLVFHASAYGWTSMVCIFSLLIGIQLFCTGILGEYLAKGYLETKKRPIYIKKEDETSKSNDSSEKSEDSSDV